MAVRNQVDFPTFVWIPPSTGAVWKVIIELNDGTQLDVTSQFISLKITDGATYTIGNFELVLPNPDARYSGVFSGMEELLFYADYAATATTLRFRGRIEKPNNTNAQLICTGRSESLFVFIRKVTQTYSSVDCGSILYSLFDTYGDGRFDLTQIPLSTGSFYSAGWAQKDFWECVKVLCETANYDCYVDCNRVVQFFPKYSVENTTDAIVKGMNLFETGEFSPDLTTIKNRIRVFGANDKAGQVIYTAQDTPANLLLYGTKEIVVNDTSVQDYESAGVLANSLLTQYLNPIITGAITGLFLPTVQPGQMLGLSDDMNNLPPNTYLCAIYTHEISPESFFTTVNIEREPRNISHILSSQFLASRAQQDTGGNPADMLFSYNFGFDSDSGTHSSTEIVSGVLKPTAASGTWISEIRNTSDLVSQFYVDWSGDTLYGVSVSVSADGGVSYDVVTARSLGNITVRGRSLLVKVVFSNANSALGNLVVQYS